MDVPESSMVADAGAVGGRTARPCDNCLLKRARWFCAADDAFLCQACDRSVHSANQLAGRHHRVRLSTASFKVCGGDSGGGSSWHRGFSKKARTQRRPASKFPPPPSFDYQAIPLVPEINAEEFLPEEKDDHLLHRVPDWDLHVDPFFDPPEIGNLAELLGGSDRFGDLLASDNGEKGFDAKRVKVEDDNEEVGAPSPFEIPKLDEIDELSWEFDYNACSEEAEKKIIAIEEEEETNIDKENNDHNGSQVKTRMLLRLNYEQVIDAWASQGCPWENGVRPHFDLDAFMVECMGGDCYKGKRNDGQSEREARVLRYREKKRMRLFSKKIRYQVRKLNAEKRPRMKGRFVKRTNSFSNHLHNQ
ncbi:zinc finger protein CONSTANS-LIKE 16 [Andrographis paniculata]|uniref:zinc finger protein CONSTANS-LIKE 16 n=1 Tax=Andrographis paniculata TaxID=175694 RepID=UPI0021E84DBD|nr:zinc finger protein CONSTANS-LIKE 16 [Andrographis paniculata]